jgi:dolichol-phosphate mannosyltransferase
MPSQPESHPPARIVCTIPTFNEAGNILALCRELLALLPDLHVLVIDDDSPDGTGRLVEDLSVTEPRVHVLRRKLDPGRGRAGRDGFVEALRLGARIVVEMDADFSHQPAHVPLLVARLDQPGPPVGLVLGSRGVAGGRDADRGWPRRLLTWAANLYIRTVLVLPVRDCNSGFRCWRRETLERIRVGETFSAGPAIVQELLFKTARAGIRIAEVPIEFANRRHGTSTLTLRKLFTGYTTVLELRWMSWIGRL